MADRKDVSRGLRALADFLDAHPDLPIASAYVSAGVFGTDEEERADVDRIAGILSVPATADERGTHYEAERDFGGGVKYRATAITRAHMDRYSAHMDQFHKGEQ